VCNAVKTARNKVNEFVREVAKDKNVDPSHGWRHRFKTVGIDQGVEMRVLDAIQGHATRNVSEGYGDVTILTEFVGGPYHNPYLMVNAQGISSIAESQ
jgi:site-specific recombinase XerD